MAPSGESRAKCTQRVSHWGPSPTMGSIRSIVPCPPELTPSSHRDLMKPRRCDVDSIQERREVSILERDRHTLQGLSQRKDRKVKASCSQKRPARRHGKRVPPPSILPGHLHRGHGLPTGLRLHRSHGVSELNQHLCTPIIKPHR